MLLFIKKIYILSNYRIRSKKRQINHRINFELKNIASTNSIKKNYKLIKYYKKFANKIKQMMRSNSIFTNSQKLNKKGNIFNIYKDQKIIDTYFIKNYKYLKNPFVITTYISFTSYSNFFLTHISNIFYDNPNFLLDNYKNIVDYFKNNFVKYFKNIKNFIVNFEKTKIKLQEQIRIIKYEKDKKNKILLKLYEFRLKDLYFNEKTLFYREEYYKSTTSCLLEIVFNYLYKNFCLFSKSRKNSNNLNNINQAKEILSNKDFLNNYKKNVDFSTPEYFLVILKKYKIKYLNFSLENLILQNFTEIKPNQKDLINNFIINFEEDKDENFKEDTKNILYDNYYYLRKPYFPLLNNRCLFCNKITFTFSEYYFKKSKKEIKSSFIITEPLCTDTTHNYNNN